MAPVPDQGGEPTQTNRVNLVAPDRSGGVLRQDQAVGPISRRRAIAGMTTAGLAAGLAAGRWAYARSGSGRRPVGASRLLWASETGGPVSSGAALADGILYIGSDDGKVHAFEAASGLPVRTFRTSGAVSGGVTVAGGTLFAGSADHRVHAFRVGPGGAAWAYPTGGPVSCTPTVANGTVYIGSDDGNVYGIDAGTGGLAWRYRTGGPVRSGPLLLPGVQTFSGSVYVGSEDSYLYALGTDGKLQWRFAASGPVTATAYAYGQGIVYVCDSHGNVFGLDSDGPPKEKIWEESVGGAVSGTPTIVANVLYIGSADSAVYAVDVYGGSPYWHYPTAGPVNSGPATDGTTVYAGDDDGYLYAIDIASISLRWRYRVGAAVRSQILLANGVVYFGSIDHHVYALRA